MQKKKIPRNEQTSKECIVPASILIQAAKTYKELSQAYVSSYIVFLTSERQELHRPIVSHISTENKEAAAVFSRVCAHVCETSEHLLFLTHP